MLLGGGAAWGKVEYYSTPNVWNNFISNKIGDFYYNSSEPPFGVKNWNVLNPYSDVWHHVVKEVLPTHWGIAAGSTVAPPATGQYYGDIYNADFGYLEFIFHLEYY